MYEWLRDHHSTINTLTNGGMLLVWIAYLQLFLWNYQRQRRAQIIIDSGAGSGLGAHCLVSNMSAEAIYVESIIVTLRQGGEDLVCPVTDLEDLEDGKHSGDPKQDTRQGPPGPGNYMVIGRFNDLVRRVLRECGRDEELEPDSFAEPATFQVYVIANYASENLLIGAKRPFDISFEAGRIRMRPCTISTHQIRGRRERSQIEGMLRRHL